MFLGCMMNIALFLIKFGSQRNYKHFTTCIMTSQCASSRASWRHNVHQHVHQDVTIGINVITCISFMNGAVIYYGMWVVICSKEQVSGWSSVEITWTVLFDQENKHNIRENSVLIHQKQIVWHKNKNKFVVDHLWRSCSLFLLGIFHSSFGLVKYPYAKTIHMISTGDHPLICSCYNIYW